MRHPTLALVLVMVAALSVGTLLGYRLRVSQEVVKVYPHRMRPPVPDDLSWRDVRLDTIEAVLRSRHA